jgi:hypothetical protein
MTTDKENKDFLAIYLPALVWFTRNNYEIKGTIQKGNEYVLMELCHHGRVIKSKTVFLDVDYPKEVHNSIINLYKHFQNESKQHIS